MSSSRFAFAFRPAVLCGALIALLLGGAVVWRFATEKAKDMIDPATHVVHCSDPMNIVATIKEVTLQSPPELREQLRSLTRNYLLQFRHKGFHERVNNKTVATILAEYDGPSEQIVIESGEKDGLRWTLYGRREEDGKPADGKPAGDKAK